MSTQICANDLYIACYGSRLYAGPSIVVAVRYLTDKVLLLDRFNVKGYYNSKFNLLEKYLDQLEEDIDYQISYKKVYVDEIAYKGYSQALSSKVGSLSAYLNSKDRVRKFYLQNNQENIGSMYFDYEKVSNQQTSYAENFARYYQMFWMRNYYASIYPKYDFKINHGGDSEDHLTKLLLHGPELNVHRLDKLRNLPRHWYRLLVMGDEWALQQNWHRASPKWWKVVFPGEPFISYLSFKERERVFKIQKRKIPGIEKLKLLPLERLEKTVKLKTKKTNNKGKHIVEHI